MKFTVIWKKSAEAELARIWLDAPPSERSKIQLACDEIDKALALGPTHVGESHSGEIHIVVYRPLAVTIAIRELDCKIYVLTVHHLP